MNEDDIIEINKRGKSMDPVQAQEFKEFIYEKFPFMKGIWD